MAAASSTQRPAAVARVPPRPWRHLRCPRRARCDTRFGGRRGWRLVCATGRPLGQSTVGALAIRVSGRRRSIRSESDSGGPGEFSHIAVAVRGILRHGASDNQVDVLGQAWTLLARAWRVPDQIPREHVSGFLMQLNTRQRGEENRPERVDASPRVERFARECLRRAKRPVKIIVVRHPPDKLWRDAEVHEDGANRRMDQKAPGPQVVRHQAPLPHCVRAGRGSIHDPYALLGIERGPREQFRQRRVRAPLKANEQASISVAERPRARAHSDGAPTRGRSRPAAAGDARRVMDRLPRG